MLPASQSSTATDDTGMNDDLADEIQSINAIYTESTLSLATSAPIICILSLPGSHQISLRLEFPSNYPATPPSILGTESVGPDVPKGLGQEVVQLARHVLSDVYVPGSPCIYDLLDELSSKSEQLISSSSGVSESASHSITTQDAGFQHGQDTSVSLSAMPDIDQTLPTLGHDPPWCLSEVVTEKKSIFVARAAYVTSPELAKAYLSHLLSTDKKVAKATHNITAWRIHGQGATAYQDCDDDGETAAGGRLLHLLQLMDAWDVMVVVTRWYGGVHLDPGRFRLINSVAREAVVKAVEGQSKEQSGSTGRGKGKK